MAEQNNEHDKKQGNRLKDLAYEPQGMPTERVRRLHHEREVPEKPQAEIKRHKEIPAHTLSEQNTQDDALAKNDMFKYSRRRMVEEQLMARGITNEYVLKAMGRTPRHLFISEALHATAYSDRPLPILSGQTISQPYVVALMCQLLLAEPAMRVLEIGTGSGYQAAILYGMGLKVFSVERIKNLYDDTYKLLKEELCYKNITLKLSDGTLGWTRYAPYDRIIVAAGGPSVPEALKEQLADGGIMLIPVGTERKKQHLIRVFKINGQCKEEDCGPVSFVDLVGKDAWR